MTAAYAGRLPTLWCGHDVTSSLTAHLTAGRETLVVADSTLAVPVDAGGAGRTMEVDARSVDVAAVLAIARRVARHRPDVIVAVGGGSILDAVKIAALVLAPKPLFDFTIERASRAALIYLPDAKPPVEIVTVPTTLGTSSETNSVAILRNERGYRLVVGDSLRPHDAILDSRNLRTLTTAAVREQALEALLRLAGAATGVGRSGRAQSHAVAIGSDLVRTADDDAASADSRLSLAQLSAATQRSEALRGPDPYSARHWYVANEVSYVLGVRKMVATAAIISAVWHRIGAGDTRWGDRRSLERFWAAIAHDAGLPGDPPVGIAALIERWGIPLPRRPRSEQIRRIGVATERWWGHRLPMLAGLRAEDIGGLLRDSVWTHSPSAGSADSRRSEGRR